MLYKFKLKTDAAVLLTSAIRFLVISSFWKKEFMRLYQGVGLISIVRSTSETYLREELNDQGAT